jgi:protoporphyrinogen oxidase
MLLQTLRKVMRTLDTLASDENRPASPRIVILGGGPAGLAIGYYAKQKGFDFKVYEANHQVGGTCRTLHHQEFSFDLGAHRLHDKNSQITQDLKDLLGNDLKKVQAPSQIYYQSKFLDFPLSPLSLLLHLGAANSIKAGVDLLQGRLTVRGEPENFEQLALQRYGRTIASRYLLNYSEKLWGIPCNQLSSNISGNRLRGLTLRTFIKEALGKKELKTEHLDGSFYYPKAGIGNISEQLAGCCGEDSIACSSKVTKIFHNRCNITAIEINNSQIIEIQKVVSTLPVTVLLKTLEPQPPQEILKVSQALRYRSLILVILFLDKPSISHNASIYFPEPQYLFTRVYEPKNRSSQMAPSKMTSLVVEVPCHQYDQLWKLSNESLVQKVSSQLQTTGWFKPQEIIDSLCYRIDYAYPVLETGYEAKVQEIASFLSSFKNLKTSGRNGKFLYTHIHDMMKFGKDIICEYEHERNSKSYYC